jgi:hypothetical protein
MINEYAFPNSTCEKTNEHGISQPYSATLNIINCVIIFYFLLRTKHVYTFMLLGSILLFELFHAFSHIIHIHSSIQTNTIHVITYFINFFVLMVFYNFTKTLPSNSFMCILLLLILFDIFALINLSLIFYILSQTFIFISLLIYYYPLLPKNFTDKLYLIVLTILAILILILNEIYNGNAMMAMYPDIPFHCLVEIFGIYLFYNICSIFYNL